ncbi:MAG: FKBP-type peptidyl-prolyl cis-trans isomerase [Methylococcales bacterium]|nr:FKBP-type peptidyl-prolyl cis-trans isomerase [Methylococcales bacterium]
MKVGGYRKFSISPHLAYKEKGIPGVILVNAKLIVEVRVVKELV